MCPEARVQQVARQPHKKSAFSRCYSFMDNNTNKSIFPVEPKKPVNGKLIDAVMRALGKEYVLIGKTRVKTWQAWLVLGLAVGAAAGIILVANRSGKFEPGKAATASRPDIVVIMADDLDVGSLNVALSQGWMPNLKKHIIDQGTTFLNSFVSFSLCCPSRATFLSGQYTHNHDVWGNGIAPYPLGGCTALNENSTVATWLQSAGYFTGHIGKYLNGYGTKLFSPKSSCLNPYHVPPGWSDWQGLKDISTYKEYNYTINDNGKLIRYGNTPADYQTDVLTKRAVNFIQKASVSPSQPFFLVVTPLAPHVEVAPLAFANCSTNYGPQMTIRPAPKYQGTANAISLPKSTSFNESDVTDKPSYVQATPQLTSSGEACLEKIYRNNIESLRSVDDLIGSVVNVLQATGRLQNTLLIFASDNGFLHGEHRLSYKVPPYEESIRVPLFIRPPGGSAPMATDRFALNNDLAPTIADFAGAVTTHTVDGVSLKPLLADPNLPNWRKRFLVELSSPSASPTAPISEDDEEKSLLVSGSFPISYAPPAFSQVRTSNLDVNTPDLTYIEYGTGEREFYDLGLSLFEMDSLHNDPSPQRVQQRQILSQWISALKNCAGVSCYNAEFK